MTSEADAAGHHDAAGAGDVAVGRAYLIAGASGMLGTALQCVLEEAGGVFHAPAEEDFDICDPVAVRHRVAEFAGTLADGQRGVLINAAAYTNVERAEEEPERAYLVNEHGAALLARAAARLDLDFVHMSTDFVFDGRKDGPYVETDEPHPLSVYGVTKLAGEKAVLAEVPDMLLVRTAWVFGPNGANFPTKIIDAARALPSLKVVNDEIGSPTYTVDLARGIVALVEAGATGVYHLAGSGSCSRFELAIEVLRLAGIEALVQPVSHDVIPMKAARPLNSVLDCDKAAALGATMPDWHDSLARFLGEAEAECT